MKITIWSLIIRLHGVKRRYALVQASLAIMLTAMAVDAADFSEVNERANSQGIVYFTVLSENDHYNSKGERLKSVAEILRQDRANYHNGNGGRRDENDGGIFATKEGRSKFETYPIVLENLSASGIINGLGSTIVVRVLGRRIYVEAVE
jgi:hypothetical protein